MVQKIWLAEDDPDDTDLFVEALKEIDQSIICRCARNGRDLISQLDAETSDHPELIFLDINMPEMNGWECLTYLKKNKDFKDIPVVVYSTSSAKKNAENAIELGAFCFYEKPSNYMIFKEFLEILTTSDLEKKTLTSKFATNSIQKVHFN